MSKITTTFVRLIDGVEVTQLGSIVMSFNVGQKGKDQYQSYLDTTSDNPVLTEGEWSASNQGGGGGVEQIQSDWNQANSLLKDFIKNKPTIPSITGLASTQSVSDETSRAIAAETALSTGKENAGVAAGLVSTETTRAEGIEATKENISNKGVNNGYAGLDSNGKINFINIPDVLVGQVNFHDLWDASTGVYPTPEAKGDYWINEVEGTISGTHYYVGDWMIWNGTAFRRVPNTDAVSTVNGHIGHVILDASDIAETSTLKWLTSTLKGFYDSAYNWVNTNGAALLSNSHTHSNKTVLDATQESFTTVLLTKLNSLVNYVLTKAGIESVFTGNITTHTHTVDLSLVVPTSRTINGLDLSANRNLVEALGYAMSDPTTDITSGIKVPCAALPYNFTITGIRAQVGKAAVGALLLTLECKKNGTSIFTTKPTFDSTELITETAATTYVMTASTIAGLTSDNFELSVYQAGGVTTAAQNLTFFFIGYKS